MDLGSIRLEIDEKKRQKSESEWKKRTSNTFFREQIIFPYLRFGSRWDRERKEILPVIAGFSTHFFFFPEAHMCQKLQQEDRARDRTRTFSTPSAQPSSLSSNHPCNRRQKAGHAHPSVSPSQNPELSLFVILWSLWERCPYAKKDDE